MSVTSRELVHQTLAFESPSRVPRQLSYLPWADERYPEELRRIAEQFPSDITSVNGYLKDPPVTHGDACKRGQYQDEWGCVFDNIADGAIGEVKNPLIEDWDADADKVVFPTGWLTIDPERINRDCAATDRFVLSGCCPRPFEQLQFIRRTDNLYMDLADPPRRMLDFLKRMHSFYCDLCERWMKTDVDALFFMDDWGSQQSLLIHPQMWRELFGPLYRDYIQIAHAADKKAFMHSDGHILSIFPDLVGMGLDAVNSQIFCMGVESLKPFAGKITFWGEVDRQHTLPYGSAEDVDRAVHNIFEGLWRDGGCIAQCEFGPGAKPENVYQVYKTWSELL